MDALDATRSAYRLGPLRENSVGEGRSSEMQ